MAKDYILQGSSSKSKGGEYLRSFPATFFAFVAFFFFLLFSPGSTVLCMWVASHRHRGNHLSRAYQNVIQDRGRWHPSCGHERFSS